MKTRREARIWVYRDCAAMSLRKHHANKQVLPKGLTDAGVRRVQAEMLALAEWLERKAARLEAALDTPEETEQDSSSSPTTTGDEPCAQ